MRGDANRSEVLRLAGAQHAAAIIVATSSDDTAVLVTLTARELAPNAKIIAAIREAENSICCSSPVPTRWWCPPRRPAGCSASPRRRRPWCEMMEDLLTPDAGFAIAEREVDQARSAARRGICPTSCSVWSATVS